VADAHVNLEIDVPADTIAAALPVLAKALTSAVAAWGALNAAQQAGPSGAEFPRVWIELPAAAATPGYTLTVPVHQHGLWYQVVPGIEFRIVDPLTNMPSLEFRFHPAGQLDA
jgi:hypothetical protein